MKDLEERNLIACLKLGIIDWFQFLELYRKMAAEKKLKPPKAGTKASTCPNS